MAWRQVSIALRAADVARAERLLELAGASALTLGDEGDDPVLEPPPGAVELWPRVRLTALFDADVPTEAVTTLITDALDVDAVVVSNVDDEDWIGGWQQAVEPIEIAPALQVVPPEAAGAAATGSAVLLNMGLAFGTGRHPTTRLCLEWLAAEPVTGARVLDYGCGSGVLALAALRRGATYAFATDNDEQALIATAENAKLNDMEERLWIGPPAALPDEQVDLIVANILAGTLQERAATLARHQQTGGRLVLSGILADQADAVIDSFSPYYDDFAVAQLDGWSRIVAVRS